MTLDKCQRHRLFMPAESRGGETDCGDGIVHIGFEINTMDIDIYHVAPELELRISIL